MERLREEAGVERRSITDYCLLSRQPLPNLLPNLDPAFRPDRVVLVVSPDMDPVVNDLRSVLPATIAVDVLAIPDAYDFPGIIRTIREHVLMRHGEGDVTRLNLTGGTKIMAMAAYRAFDGGRLGPMYYLNIQTDRLDWVDETERRPSMPLRSVLDLRTYFTAHRYELVQDHGAPPDARHEAFAWDVGRRCVALQDALLTINQAIDHAYQKRMPQGDSVPIAPPYARRIDPMLAIAEAHGLLRWRNHRIELTGDKQGMTATLVALRGGWLESYLHAVVARYAGRGVQDSFANVRIRDAKGSMNEVDLVFLAQHQLTVIECKTTISQNDLYAKAIYKLVALKQALRSLTSRMVLASLQSLTKPLVDRASQNGIELIIGPAAVQDFDRSLERWMNPSATKGV